MAVKPISLDSIFAEHNLRDDECAKLRCTEDEPSGLLNALWHLEQARELLELS